MRKLTLFAALLCSISLCFGRTYTVEQVPNVQILDATRYTSNPDGILSQSAVEAIDRACDSLHSASRAQIAVVAIEDIEGDDVFQFAFDLFSAWGVGGKSSDNGLGILLVTEKREIRFVTGYGLEGVLTDAMCKRIQQRYMVSHLSAGDYSTGMVEGVAAVARIISGSEELSAQSDESDEDFIIFILSFFGFVVLLIAIVSIAVWMSRKCPKCGKHTLVRTTSVKISSTRQYNIMLHTYRCSNCGHTKEQQEKIYKSTGGTYVGGGRGFGGGGSFGGGFGGGSFGGGGAGSRF
ncbi:MAG: TPM domain-containing protein [Alistipes sp.]|nr:TPM domain-containing protein [Alistipes sp.]